MHAAESSEVSRRATPRRLSTHVLAPLAVVGVVAVAAASAAVTIGQRDAAIHALDVRAEVVRDASKAALKRTGKIEAAKALPGIKLRLLPADTPLPGGRSAEMRGNSRVYTFGLGARYEGRRLRVTVPAESVRSTTMRALLLSASAGLLVLLLLLGLVRHRLKRGAGAPLKRLGAAVELLAAGEVARVDHIGGAAGVQGGPGGPGGGAAADPEVVPAAAPRPPPPAAQRGSLPH